MNALASLVAAVLGGALAALPFVEPSLAPLSFIGFAPALLALVPPRGVPGFWSLVALTLLAGCTAAILVALPLGKIAVLAMLIEALPILPWAWLGLLAFAILRRRTGWPIVVLWPCCWIVAEWGWSYHSLGSLAFGLSGYTQFVYPRLIQFAHITGVLGVSFLLQMVVGALADTALVVWADGWPALRSRRALAPLAVAGGALVLALSYGTVRLAGAHGTPGPRLAMVQPAVPHDYDPAQIHMVHLTQLGLARRAVRPGEVDLVVFPENAVLEYIEGTEHLTRFQELSARLATPLLAGVTTRTAADLARWRRGEPEEAVVTIKGRPAGRVHNSAALITDKGIVDKYDKVHLLPFSEEVPLQGLFSTLGMLGGYRDFVIGILGYMGTAVPGPGARPLSIPGSAAPPFFAPLCFEQADARLSREAVNAGARFLINVTSEGDLGPQIYWNTVAVAVLRAAELNVGIARCGNMGISCLIDPWGRQTQHLRGKTGALWGESGVLKGRVMLGSGAPTLYARLGDWPVGVAALLLALATASAIRRPRRGANPT